MIKYILVLMLFINVSYAESGKNECLSNGGQISTLQTPHGKEYKVCTFEDNRQCDLKALHKKWCKVGGVKITGYDNQEQIYCAINGGKVRAEPDAICVLPNGKQIKAIKFYN